MRDDGRGGYDYNIDVSRSFAQRGGAGSVAQHVATSMAQYPSEMHLLSSGGLPASYRGGNSYGNMGAKPPYYPLGGEWADAYGADGGGVDYGLSCPPYPVINSDLTYGHWNGAGARHKTASHGSNVYLDSDAGYGYGTGSTASLVHRPAVSVAGSSGGGGGGGGGDSSGAYSMSSIAASLASTGNTGSERLLPTPVSRALGSASTVSNYRADGLPSGYSSLSIKSSHGTAVSSGGAGSVSPVSTMADVTSVAAVAGYASSAYDYATTVRASQHHGSGSGGDVYSSVSSGGPETIFGDSDRNAATQGPAVDLTGYTYGTGAGVGAGTGSPADTSNLRRASSGSGLTSRSAANSSPASTSTYVGSDGGASVVHTSGAYHHSGSMSSSSSSSHGHHHHSNNNNNSHSHSQHHNTSSHHAAPRHGSRHHHVSQHHHQHQQQQHAVTGVTYGDAPGSDSASNGVGNTTVGEVSHRTSLPNSRR